MSCCYILNIPQPQALNKPQVLPPSCVDSLMRTPSGSGSAFGRGANGEKLRRLWRCYFLLFVLRLMGSDGVSTALCLAPLFVKRVYRYSLVKGMGVARTSNPRHAASNPDLFRPTCGGCEGRTRAAAGLSLWLRIGRGVGKEYPLPTTCHQNPCTPLQLPSPCTPPELPSCNSRAVPRIAASGAEFGALAAEHCEGQDRIGLQ